jgi:hypothetical protein
MYTESRETSDRGEKDRELRISKLSPPIGENALSALLDPELVSGSISNNPTGRAAVNGHGVDIPHTIRTDVIVTHNTRKARFEVSPQSTDIVLQTLIAYLESSELSRFELEKVHKDASLDGTDKENEIEKRTKALNRRLIFVDKTGNVFDDMVFNGFDAINRKQPDLESIATFSYANNKNSEVHDDISIPVLDIEAITFTSVGSPENP